MDGESRNLQNEFFNQARRERVVVTIYLTNGKKLTGRIKSFDKFSLLLDGHYGEQVIYKHAISTIGHSARTAAQRPQPDAEVADIS